MKLVNRTVLITGGSSGMGLEMAKELLQRRNIFIIAGKTLRVKLRSVSAGLSA